MILRLLLLLLTGLMIFESGAFADQSKPRNFRNTNSRVERSDSRPDLAVEFAEAAQLKIGSRKSTFHIGEMGHHRYSPGLGRYEFEDERAYIEYAKGCDQLKVCLCLVPKDTVISIFVTLESDLKLSQVKIDRSKYKKSRSAHLPSIVNFTNDEEGITYTVDEADGEVMHITYLPVARDCQKLIHRALRGPRR